MTLRPATPDDAPAIAAILVGWVQETPWMPKLHTPEEDRWFAGHLIATQEVTVLVLPEVAGFLARAGEDISALYLSAGARGQGHGSRLLAAAMAGRERLGLWTFQANAGARRFYARAGFREVAMTDGAGNDERLPDVQMQWERPS